MKSLFKLSITMLIIFVGIPLSSTMAIAASDQRSTISASTSFTCATPTDGEYPRLTTCSCIGGRSSADCSAMLRSDCKSRVKVELVCTPDRKCSCNSKSKSGSSSKPSNKPYASQLRAPSHLAISEAGTNKLVLSWQDNSTREFGVALYRIQASNSKIRNFKNAEWRYIGTFQERISSNVAGKGKRSELDTELIPNTKYCYKMQAYVGFDKSEISDFSNIVCGNTASRRQID